MSVKTRGENGEVIIEDSTTDENLRFDESEESEAVMPDTETTEKAAEEKTEEKATSETAEGAETTETTTETEVDGEIPEKDDETSDDPKGFQKRINELTLKRRTAEREAETLKKENESLRKEAESRKETSAAEETKETSAAGKPKVDDYADYADFMEALSEWKSKDIIAAERKKWEAEKAEEAANTATEQQQKVIDGSLEEGRKKHEDFDKVAMAENIPYSQAMIEVVTESDKFTEIAYYLGQNLDEADRISRLSPLAAAKEIGKIEANLTSGKTTKKLTAAQPPITPLKATEVVGKDPNDMTNAEFEKWRNEGQK